MHKSNLPLELSNIYVVVFRKSKIIFLLVTLLFPYNRVHTSASFRFQKSPILYKTKVQHD